MLRAATSFDQGTLRQRFYAGDLFLDPSPLFVEGSHGDVSRGAEDAAQPLASLTQYCMDKKYASCSHALC